MTRNQTTAEQVKGFNERTARRGPAELLDRFAREQAALESVGVPGGTLASGPMPDGRLLDAHHARGLRLRAYGPGRRRRGRDGAVSLVGLGHDVIDAAGLVTCSACSGRSRQFAGRSPAWGSSLLGGDS